MDPQKRKSLTTELQGLVAEIAADLLDQLQATGSARERAKALHRDERVGDDFDVWLDLLSRRAAVLWVLKTVYIRVLEDRGFLTPIRLRNRDTQELFHHLAPALADSAFLHWAFKDLAAAGGLPELFAPQPAEVVQPRNAPSKRLLDFWRQTDEVTQEVRHRFDEEHFDGRLLGDLYQDLDPVVKERFALFQTPDFVVDFILDHTLEPAIKEFGPENIRILDPACGSGHFLIAAFKRLATAALAREAGTPAPQIVARALEQVVGIDLNDYACGLCRARLVMTAVELAGSAELSLGGSLHPQVFWADGLECVEEDEQLTLTSNEAAFELKATLTRPETRRALRTVLAGGFSVVVGNPPYITEKDPAQKAYHRAKVGRSRRYVSAVKQYSLAAPFIERMFALASPGGFVGGIIANSFMKRDFGKPLIEQVLSKYDLLTVVDPSGVNLPGHGTPTVLLFARQQRPSPLSPLVVTCKRAHPEVTDDPASSRAWKSIRSACETGAVEDDEVSSRSVARHTLSTYPWTFGASEVDSLKAKIEDAACARLSDVLSDIGRSTHTGQDDIFFMSRRALLRLGFGEQEVVPLVRGEQVRDWAIAPGEYSLFPYDLDTGEARQPTGRAFDYLWRYRTTLRSRSDYGETIENRQYAGRRLKWFEHSMFFRERYLGIDKCLIFAFKSTNNHFAYTGQRLLSNRTAPIIQMAGSSDSQRLTVLAQLCSSVGCFWLKRVCQNVGEGGGARVAAGNAIMGSEAWKNCYEHDTKKLRPFPLASTDHSELADLARRLLDVVRGRARTGASATVDTAAPHGATAIRSALASRRSADIALLSHAVSIQESIDWLCYRLYGLLEIASGDNWPPSDGLLPGLRPFEVALADTPTASDEDPSTEYFTRHGWAPTSLSALPSSMTAPIALRLEQATSSADLAVLEQATYKRRWTKPDYDAEDECALREWLADRLEDWASRRRGPFSLADATADLQSDSGILAVAEVLSGRADFDLQGLLDGVLFESSVPNQKHHVFASSGLTKRVVWERTWKNQRREDAGTATSADLDAFSVPPKYAKEDYLRDSYWELRGALDVPTERFVLLSELPGHEPGRGLYFWAGITSRERAKLLVELDEGAERNGVAVDARIGLLHGFWSLADFVSLESEVAANEYRAAATAVVGQAGVTDELLLAWAARNPAPYVRRAKAKARKLKSSKEPNES